MSCGLSIREAAVRVGVETGWAKTRLRELRLEIERLSV
jgi:hypothetical protein